MGCAAVAPSSDASGSNDDLTGGVLVTLACASRSIRSVHEPDLSRRANLEQVGGDESNDVVIGKRGRFGAKPYRRAIDAGVPLCHGGIAVVSVLRAASRSSRVTG
jgi:hypothetical protein